MNPLVKPMTETDWLREENARLRAVNAEAIVLLKIHWRTSSCLRAAVQPDRLTCLEAGGARCNYCDIASFFGGGDR